ncbi:hypothetical protein OEZ85_003171 [Tetradesmus obliquus]|uniref:Big-1 domain-containing protein n=1 Tax=Tetradesmus obliquus TaxID=3088 RepID=A0ABY8TZW1_TETOB|nr:hypothetical protein OEZ85_003171 [Tetradesmus obliquus]
MQVPVSASYVVNGIPQPGKTIVFTITDPATGVNTTRTAVTDASGIATLPDLVLSSSGQLLVTAKTVGALGTLTSTVSTYTWTNSPPVAAPDTYPYIPRPGPCATAFICTDPLTVTAAKGVLKNDFDSDDQPITATLVSTVSNGVLTFNGNGFVYTPNLGYTGTDSFVYRACDPLNACSQATVTLTPNVQPPNVALLADLPGEFTGTPPSLSADRASAAGTDCTENPATALSTVTLTSPGDGQCTGATPAGDYTLSETASDQTLLFEYWTCYTANVVAGPPTEKTPTGTNQYSIAQGESVTCVAKYKLYLPPTVYLQVKWPCSDIPTDAARPDLGVTNGGSPVCTLPDAATSANPSITLPGPISKCNAYLPPGAVMVGATIESSKANPAITCYDITGGASTQLTTDGSIPNDGLGKTISCIVEYGPLGDGCDPGYYQPFNGAACLACGLNFYCPDVVVTGQSGGSNSQAELWKISGYLDPSTGSLSQGFVSNIVGDDTADSGIQLQQVAELNVAECKGGSGSDTTTGPDGHVYLWCSDNSRTNNYYAWRFAVESSGDKAGYLIPGSIQAVNDGLDPASDDTNAGAFCTAAMTVGMSTTPINTRTTSNFWRFGVGFTDGGGSPAKRISTFNAGATIGTTGGAVKPECSGQIYSDFRFLPPIPNDDTYNVNEAGTQFLSVLSNDWDPQYGELRDVKLLDGSGAMVNSLTLTSGVDVVGTVTVVAGANIGDPNRVQFEPGAGIAAGQTVSFQYKAVDAFGISANPIVMSTVAATVRLTVENPP